MDDIPSKDKNEYKFTNKTRMNIKEERLYKAEAEEPMGVKCKLY